MAACWEVRAVRVLDRLIDSKSESSAPDAVRSAADTRGAASTPPDRAGRELAPSESGGRRDRIHAYGAATHARPTLTRGSNRPRARSSRRTDPPAGARGGVPADVCSRARAGAVGRSTRVRPDAQPPARRGVAPFAVPDARTRERTRRPGDRRAGRCREVRAGTRLAGVLPTRLRARRPLDLQRPVRSAAAPERRFPPASFA